MAKPKVPTSSKFKANVEDLEAFFIEMDAYSVMAPLISGGILRQLPDFFDQVFYLGSLGSGVRGG